MSLMAVKPTQKRRNSLQQRRQRLNCRSACLAHPLAGQLRRERKVVLTPTPLADMRVGRTVSPLVIVRAVRERILAEDLSHPWVTVP